MLTLTTYLHLADKLKDKINIKDINSFYLGCIYPLCNKDYNYGISSFDIGYYFHKKINQYMNNIDISDISEYDMIILGMPNIAHIVEELKDYTYTDKELESFEKILTLESTPVPLYMVREDIRVQYNDILEQLVTEFINEHSK